MSLWSSPMWSPSKKNPKKWREDVNENSFFLKSKNLFSKLWMIMKKGWHTLFCHLYNSFSLSSSFCHHSPFASNCLGSTISLKLLLKSKKKIQGSTKDLPRFFKDTCGTWLIDITNDIQVSSPAKVQFYKFVPNIDENICSLANRHDNHKSFESHESYKQFANTQQARKVFSHRC